MKEAVVINPVGNIFETMIVPDKQTGVTPIYAASEPRDGNQEPELTGYLVAERVPEGFFLPKWDFTESQWVEGLSPEEIDAIRSVPQPETPQQQIDKLVSDLDEAKSQLVIARDDNLTLMEAVAELYEMLLTQKTND